MVTTAVEPDDAARSREGSAVATNRRRITALCFKATIDDPTRFK
jgi:hypothetical protein